MSKKDPQVKVEVVYNMEDLTPEVIANFERMVQSLNKERLGTMTSATAFCAALEKAQTLDQKRGVYMTFLELGGACMAEVIAHSRSRVQVVSLDGVTAVNLRETG